MTAETPTVWIVYGVDWTPYVVAVFTDELTALRFLAENSGMSYHVHAQPDGEFNP